MPDAVWLQVTVPWTSAWSKNKMWRKGKWGNIHLNPDSEAARDELTLLLKAQLRGRQWPTCKTHVAIFCQRDTMKRDPSNVDDLILDAVKTAIGLDDRWFAHSNDWELVRKQPPTLTITVYPKEDAE